MFKHILIPADGSPVSNRAAKTSIALASALGGKVTAYWAVEPFQPIFVESSEIASIRMEPTKFAEVCHD